MSAPFPGEVVGIAPGLQPGVWVHRGEPLLQVVGDDVPKVDVYVAAEDVARIRVGDEARFVPDDPDVAAATCEVAFVDKVALSQLEHAYVGSPHGGTVPAHVDAQGQTVPLHATFRVRLAACGPHARAKQEQPGIALVGSAGRSVLQGWWQQAAGLWHRERGF